MEAGSLTDEQALRRLRRDPGAICVLYDRYVARVVRFLQGHGATRETAWDVAQETFAKLLLKRGCTVAADGSIWPWLSISAQNLFRDWHRRGRIDDRARRKIGAAVIPAGDGELDAALARLESESSEAELAAALADLPADQRTAIESRIIKEADYSEIAASTGVSEQVIRSRVSRGLRAMRTHLEGGRR